jgi:hypothetical protein
LHVRNSHAPGRGARSTVVQSRNLGGHLEDHDAVDAGVSALVEAQIIKAGFCNSPSLVSRGGVWGARSDARVVVFDRQPRLTAPVGGDPVLSGRLMVERSSEFD